MTDPRLQLLIGDCRETLRTLPAESVHCVVTSPPYWGLRDYGVDGQIGLEASLEDFVSQLVAVFREVRRVMRKDATLWLNLGDSYAACAKDRTPEQASAKSSLQGSRRTQGGVLKQQNKIVGGLKPKDLVGVPWRVAFALQSDGWYLRQDIIWHKPNPMPESIRDRCTKAHEYLFLLSKSQRYFYDQDAIKDPADQKSIDRYNYRFGGAKNEALVEADANGVGNRTRVVGMRTLGPKGQQCDDRTNLASAGARQGRGAGWREDAENWRLTANKRSVWTVTTQPFPGSHFATFPPALIEPCILAGCPEGGTVLDPFGGSGTTAGVAIKHGRRAILCELNPAYAAMVDARVRGIAEYEFGLFKEATA